MSPDLADVPTEGWLYNDWTKWNDNDTTITVTGKGVAIKLLERQFQLENCSIILRCLLFRSLCRKWETMVQRKIFPWGKRMLRG